MRILYLTEEPISFSGTMVRGGQIHVQRVVSGLRERGHDVHVIDWNSENDDRRFHHSLRPRLRFGIDPSRTALYALGIARNVEPDVIISKTRKTYLPGLIVARLVGSPHVVHVGSSPGSVNGSLGSKLEMASIVGRLHAGHDAFFVVCDALASELENFGLPRDRVFNVGNAVDTQQFHPENIPTPLDETYQRRLDSIAGSDFVLGYVGGLHSYKGLDDLAGAIDRSDREVRVAIAGDGPERDRLERRFGNDAVFLGPVPYEQIPALYHEFDVFVLPSHTEGLPRVILEAQASGVPVIATRVGGVSEVVADGESGLLCKPGDPDGLAETIDELVGDTELQSNLGSNGRESVVSRFDWEGLFGRYERYLNHVVGSGGTDEFR